MASEAMDIKVKRVKENNPDLTIEDLEIFHSACSDGKVVISKDNNSDYYYFNCKRCSSKSLVDTEEAAKIFRIAVEGGSGKYSNSYRSNVICIE